MKTIERKTLVTDEAQIKVGALLELVNCVDCHRTHRSVVVDHAVTDDWEFVDNDDKDEIPSEHGWRLVPNCEGQPPDVKWLDLHGPILKRLVYRIETGLLDEANPYVEVKRPVGVRQ